MAGANAALHVRGEEPLILDRSDAYLGVLIDDLTTKGTEEPYRMFTSLAEYRLLLRQDNADLRLTEWGRKIGLVSDNRYNQYVRRKNMIDAERQRLLATKVHPVERIQEGLRRADTSPLSRPATLAELLRRPEVGYDFVEAVAPSPEALPEDVTESVEIEMKYEGYIRRQEEQVKRFREMEEKPLPEKIDFHGLPVISHEAAEKLHRVRPRSLGQASRIPGVSPADISALMIFLKQKAAQGLA